MAMTAIDTNVLVGLMDRRDKWHNSAVAIRDALNKVGAEIVYFDCVLNEVISVLARRANEQKRPEEIGDLLGNLQRLIPSNDITWISEDIRRLYSITSKVFVFWAKLYSVKCPNLVLQKLNIKIQIAK